MDMTNINETGKLMKTLYMHMRELLVQSDDNIMCGVDTPGIFVMNIEQDHVYSILIESVDAKVLTVRNKRYTVVNDTAHNKRVCINIRINDYNEDAAAEDYIGDYSILKLVAWGSEPNIYKTIRIMDITEETQFTCTTDESKTEIDKPSFTYKRNFTRDADKQKVMISSVQKLFPNDTQSSKSNASNNNDDNCAEETCDNTNVDKTAGDCNTDDLREELEAIQMDVSRLIDTVNSISNRNKTLQRDLADLLPYPEYEGLSEAGTLLTEYITKTNYHSKRLRVFLDLFHNKLEK